LADAKLKRCWRFKGFGLGGTMFRRLMKRGAVVGAAVALVMVSVAPAAADPGDVPYGDYLTVTTETGLSLTRSDFSFFPTPTKWGVGPNVATVGGFPSPGSATWSIMGAGHSDVSGFDTGHAGLTALITALGVPGFGVADYAAMFEAALDVWEAVSLFTNLGQVADGGVNAGASQATGGHLGDIRIAAWEIAAATTLAHAFQPGTEAIFGAGGTVAGDLHFDVARLWRDDPTDTTADADFDLFTVALHEFGHALGLGHSAVVGSVMEPVYAGARRTLHADDIAGIRAIYGARVVTPPVPEPASLLLFGAALGGYGWMRRRKKQ
jgi:hypothetical protein